MASDEEIARHVARAEGGVHGRTPGGVDGNADGGSTAHEELAEYRAVASEIHDELARRIERVDDETPDDAALEDVVDRLDRLEERIADLEARS